MLRVNVVLAHETFAQSIRATVTCDLCSEGWPSQSLVIRSQAVLSCVAVKLHSLGCSKLWICTVRAPLLTKGQAAQQHDCLCCAIWCLTVYRCG